MASTLRATDNKCDVATIFQDLETWFSVSLKMLWNSGFSCPILEILGGLEDF